MIDQVCAVPQPSDRLKQTVHDHGAGQQKRGSNDCRAERREYNNFQDADRGDGNDGECQPKVNGVFCRALPGNAEKQLSIRFGVAGLIFLPPAELKISDREPNDKNQCGNFR